MNIRAIQWRIPAMLDSLPYPQRWPSGFLVASTLLFAGLANGACIGGSPNWTAASSNFVDVNACVTAAKDGDTINVPAGSSNWGASAINTTKGVNIIGAGIGNTTLQNAGISMSSPDGTAWRVSGFTFTGTSGVAAGGGSKAFRIDHNRFNTVMGMTLNRIIWIQPAAGAYQQGVIDNNVFDNPQSIQIHIRGNSADGGNVSWNRPAGLGNADAIYIEDNQFNHATLLVSAPMMDCDGGGRFVFRYNTSKNTYIEMHDAIVTNYRGCRKFEIYNNTFQKTFNSGQSTYLHLRSGVGVVHDNVFAQATDNSEMQLHLYRAEGTTGGDPWSLACSNSGRKACLASNLTWSRSCTSDTDCGGIAGACIVIDGAAASPNGYPCRDQMGWDGNTSRSLLPVLFWNNKYPSGASVSPQSSAGNYYRSGVDYCSAATSMPSICNGVTTNYVAYPHPHPLRGGGLPPNNLRTQ